MFYPNSITLGEGNTPTIRLINLEKILNWRGQLWAKCEYQNPTGSFKDRGSVTEINAALVQKKRGVVCASTGNMAASLAAYAAQAKLTCVIFAPDITPSSKLKQAAVCGAQLKLIKGNYDSCNLQAKRFSNINNYLLCGDYYYRRLGQSTVGLELAQANLLFDSYIVPIGNGTLSCAVAQGLATYGKFPKLLGVQGKGADPLFQAWKSKSIIEPQTTPTTCASAMNVGNPLDGVPTLRWIKRTNGAVYSVSDKQIKAAQQILAQTEGVFIEAAAATTVAAINKISNQNSNIVLILTGSGLKEGGV